MSQVIVPQRRIWTRQPKIVPKIDLSNPITRGLAFCAVPLLGDLVSGAQPVLSGSSRLGIAQPGVSFKSPSTQIPGAWTFAVNIPAAFDVTVVCLFRCITPNPATGGAPTLYFNSTEPVLFSSTGDQTVFYTASNSSNVISGLAKGNVYSLAGVKRGNAQDQYVNGGFINTGITGNRTVSAITSVSAGRPGGGNNLENVEYFIALYFTRALSAYEIKSLSDNPWQIFAKRDRYAFVSLGGGSSVGLAIADGTHSHISDSLLLSWQDLLTVSDAAHSHSSDPVALSTRWLLAVQDALHAHAADNFGLSSTGSTSLSVNDATHAHVVDGISLTTRWLLSIADGAHSHTADNLTLDTSNTTWLTVQDSAHGHASDNLALTLNTWLSIVDAAHAHYADAPTLTAETALQIAEVLHATYADTLVLSLPGAPGSYPSAESIAAAVVAALQGTTIPVDARLMNGAPVVGDGSELNPWRGVGV